MRGFRLLVFLYIIVSYIKIVDFSFIAQFDFMTEIPEVHVFYKQYVFRNETRV